MLAQETGDSKVATNLQNRVSQSDVIVVGEFRGTENRRKAQAPIKVLDVLRGQLSPDGNLVTCFRASALTITPKRGSRWIFFLQKPFEVKGEVEYRKVVGQYGPEDRILNDDYDGIVPATAENVAAVKDLLKPSKAQKREPQGPK